MGYSRKITLLPAYVIIIHINVFNSTFWDICLYSFETRIGLQKIKLRPFQNGESTGFSRICMLYRSMRKDDLKNCPLLSFHGHLLNCFKTILGWYICGFYRKLDLPEAYFIFNPKESREWCRPLLVNTVCFENEKKTEKWFESCLLYN